MRRFLKLVLVGLLASLTLAFVSLSSRAADDLTEDYIRWMNTGESFSVEAYLFKDESLSGVCSQDCYDIDLTLYDADTKKVVMQDYENTATPSIIAPYEGDFTVEVQMVNCARTGGCRTWISYGDTP